MSETIVVPKPIGICDECFNNNLRASWSKSKSVSVYCRHNNAEAHGEVKHVLLDGETRTSWAVIQWNIAYPMPAIAFMKAPDLD